ncbi:MAG: ATP-binding protein [Acholeplasmataceae bacterium]
MKKHQNFQDVILKIATELINIDIDQFDQKINEVLALVGMFLDVDRVYVFEYDHEKKVTNNIFEWTHEGVTKQIDHLQNISMSLIDDVWVKPHLEGRAVIYEQVSSLQKNHALYHILVPQGIKSVTTLPLMSNQTCLGFVGFDDVRQERTWNQLEMDLLKVLSSVITNAILKQQQQETLVDLKLKADEASLEKNQFLAKISHEFRTPLHGITNALYLLESTTLNKEQREYFDIAQFSTKSLMSMINEILDISRIESGEIEIFEDVFDLENELVNIILSEQSYAIEKRLDLELDYDYKISHYLVGDYPKLRQVILNLLNNAIKYTQSGSIKISVTLIKEVKDDIKLKFEILDTGIGIKNEYFDKIFDKFYQIDSGDSRKYEGTGLGLSIVKQLLDKMGSKIVVQSKPNTGSTFTFDLTFKKQRPYSFDLASGLHVLITDQNIYTRRLKEMLESMGMQVDDEVSEHKRIYDMIVFNEAKSFKMLHFFKDNFAHMKSIMVAMGDIEHIHDKDVDIYFNQMISRKNIYHKMVSNIQEKKQYAEDVFHKALTGYALIVDDNRLNRIALENILKKQGLKSKLVDSGAKAIEAARNERFDIILMDIQMPEMDGIETSKHIRSLGPQYKNLPIIAVTANAFLNDYDLMKHAQMNDVLFKPISIEALERILRKHLSHHRQIFVPAVHQVFDQKDYEYRFDESYDIAKTVIESFIEIYQGDLLSIEEAIKSNRPNIIKEKLHYFKGSCSYLSGKRTTWLLTTMMELNEQNQKEALQNAFEVLVYEVDKLVEQLKKYLESLT